MRSGSKNRLLSTSIRPGAIVISQYIRYPVDLCTSAFTLVAQLHTSVPAGSKLVSQRSRVGVVRADVRQVYLVHYTTLPANDRCIQTDGCPCVESERSRDGRHVVTAKQTSTAH